MTANKFTMALPQYRQPMANHPLFGKSKISPKCVVFTIFTLISLDVRKRRKVNSGRELPIPMRSAEHISLQLRWMTLGSRNLGSTAQSVKITLNHAICMSTDQILQCRSLETNAVRLL